MKKLLLRLMRILGWKRAITLEKTMFEKGMLVENDGGKLDIPPLRASFYA